MIAQAGGVSAGWLAGEDIDTSDRIHEPRVPYVVQRRGVDPVFIRNAVRIVERRLEQDMDLESKARVIADVAVDLQEMHDQEWNQGAPPDAED